MEINSLVIVSLANPREKVWGLLRALSPAGITLKAIELDSFDDFVRQIIDRDEAIVGMATVFYPMHRVERIAMDEASGAIPSLSDRFQQKVGITVRGYLGVEAPKI